MNTKKIAVVQAESGVIHDIEIPSGATAGEILQQCGLSSTHKLSSPDGATFNNSDVVADKVADGGKLYASVVPEVG